MDDPEEAVYQKTIKSPTPLDPDIAAQRLKEVKRIFDDQGITFWLGSGTCLGAIREGRFIPWDDEMDTASIIGMHGLTEETIYRVADVFRAHGFIPRVRPSPRHISFNVIKDGIRTDWTCHRIVNGRAYEFPGVELPLHIYTSLKEIEFIGERFFVPDPPEEYLLAKYGPEWRTPKGPGFEADVVGQVPDRGLLSPRIRLLWALTRGRLPSSAVRLRIFDRDGAPVRGAQVAVAGIGRTTTNALGDARFPVPGESYYAVTVTYPGHHEVLYEEVLTPGGRYTYRPGPIVTPEEHYKAGVRALALIRE